MAQDLVQVAQDLVQVTLEQKIDGMMEKLGDIWRCTVCGKVAEDSKARGNLKRHVETHLEGISHPCDICGHSSTSSGGLYQHKAKKHSELRPNKIYKKKLAMTAVVGYDTTAAPHPTTIAFEELEERISALVEKRGSPGEEMLTCTACGKTMPLEKKWAIRRHAEVHLEGMSFPCDTCGKVSKSSHGLYQHKAKQHPWLRQMEQENAKYKCNICGKASKTSKGLSNHKWKYHKPGASIPYVTTPNGSFRPDQTGQGGIQQPVATIEVKYEQNDSLMDSDSSKSGDERHHDHLRVGFKV